MEDHLIQRYFSTGMQQAEIIALLAVRHNIIISERNFKRILKRLRLYRRKYYSKIEDLIAYIERELQFSNQLHGYRWMHLKCLQNKFVVTQETVRLILLSLDPTGVQIRKRNRLRRRQYFNNGPNFMWHMDSYDKLKPSGIAINGCIDGFSRKIIWLEAGYTSSDPKVIAGYFINTVEKLGGCPQRIRSDMGTENRYVEQMQTFFVQEGTMPFLYGTSQANQRIEAWWSVLRKHCSQFWMNLFTKLKDDGFFDGSPIDKALVQFCFLKIIQTELDTLVKEWNTHNIRKRKNAVAPSGRPYLMYNLPELYNTQDYLHQISQGKIDICKEYCIFQSNIICDEDVYELSCLIMQERNLIMEVDAYEAINLYLTLRREILSLL